MKHKLSITMDEETILDIRNRLRDKLFRNKSHLIEYAVQRFLKDE